MSIIIITHDLGVVITCAIRLWCMGARSWKQEPVMKSSDPH